MAYLVHANDKNNVWPLCLSSIFESNTQKAKTHETVFMRDCENSGFVGHKGIFRGSTGPRCCLSCSPLLQIMWQSVLLKVPAQQSANTL